MKSNLNFFAFLLVITFFSCKNGSTFSDFQYAEKPETITCQGLVPNLYKEALYAFEDDIVAFYGKEKPNNSLTQAYYQFIRDANAKRVNYSGIASEHTLKIFEALKNEGDLWDAENPNSHLNYKGTLMSCVATNIHDESLKTTMNALISTNSMSPKLFGAPLMSSYRSILSDKYLATYVAFDLFYANLFNLNKTPQS
ncbi:hypothetical protein [Aestuariibaculum suncheonense]|uniref:Uncharacterized protein n=1 Tax=Aestuariibaculum suncheonense TaxID=1028745 RepID=A0A8J6ULV0_9FLAO|nr:hypothetical protein [Aestuariibaculum suncheonense]MBD0836506.1 hypothetical protein [Aestuariibaculum suncheonense]